MSARYWIADYSVPRARERLRLAREEAKKPGPEKAARRQELNKKIRVKGCLFAFVKELDLKHSVD